MIVMKSTHDAMIADRDHWKAEADRGVDLLAKAREEKRTVGAALNEALKERDEARAKLRTGNGNLRQFRKPVIEHLPPIN